MAASVKQYSAYNEHTAEYNNRSMGFSVVAPEVAVPGKTTAVLVTLHGRAGEEPLDPLNVTVRLETQDADNDVKLLTTASQMITVLTFSGPMKLIVFTTLVQKK
ncbi:unnamed protein product [Diatraea saccharalis]|uniref:Uncharacterized protein n=1 Tax=Diatraea saccharalis TaxID=40085 RepID=A0A9N9WE48_9NEOP|nr:unnamed protein product [Diatraea saccharalis]